METMTREQVIEMLRENREAVINEIEWQYRSDIKNGSRTLKGIMEKFIDVVISNSVNIHENRLKTDLRQYVRIMRGREQRERREQMFIERFGTRHPKQAELIGDMKERGWI